MRGILVKGKKNCDSAKQDSCGYTELLVLRRVRGSAWVMGSNSGYLHCKPE